MVGMAMRGRLLAAQLLTSIRGGPGRKIVGKSEEKNTPAPRHEQGGPGGAEFTPEAGEPASNFRAWQICCVVSLGLWPPFRPRGRAADSPASIADTAVEPAGRPAQPSQPVMPAGQIATEAGTSPASQQPPGCVMLPGNQGGWAAHSVKCRPKQDDRGCRPAESGEVT